MDDFSDKVFDVSKPSKIYPSDSSRPLIVGHRPQTTDPMVHRPIARPQPLAPADETASSGPTAAIGFEHDKNDDTPPLSHQPKVIAVSQDLQNQVASQNPPNLPPNEPSQPSAPPTVDAQAVSTPAPDEVSASLSTSTTPATDPAATPAAAEPVEPPLPHHSLPMGHPPNSATGRLRRFGPWLIVALLLIAFVGYLAIDAGFIASGVKLPFHVFSR